MKFINWYHQGKNRFKNQKIRFSQFLPGRRSLLAELSIEELLDLMRRTIFIGGWIFFYRKFHFWICPQRRKANSSCDLGYAKCPDLLKIMTYHSLKSQPRPAVRVVRTSVLSMAGWGPSPVTAVHGIDFSWKGFALSLAYVGCGNEVRLGSGGVSDEVGDCGFDGWKPQRFLVYRK